jgi:GAF domain-containing protein
MAIVVFGVLLIVCVVLLLRRQAGELARWDGSAEAGAATGRYLQRLHRLLRAIRATNSVIVSERDSLRLMEKVCLTLTTTRGYKLAWIGLVEEGTKRVRPVMRAGFEGGYLDNVEITWDDSPTGQGPTGRAIKTGEPYVMRDIETAPEYRLWREQALQRGFRSSAALPLRCRGRVMGALCVYSETPDAFDIEELGLLQEVADHLAYALSSIQLEEELTRVKHQTRQSDRVQAAFERVPVGLMTADRDGVITSINAAMLRLLGRQETPEQVVDRLKLNDLEMFRSSAARSSVEKMLSDGTPATLEFQTPSGGGGSRILSCRGLPLREEGERPSGIMWVVEQVPAA